MFSGSAMGATDDQVEAERDSNRYGHHPIGRTDMKFGILYNTDYYPAAHQSPSNYYAQLLEQTELAEKLGFDAVWFGEHHYSGYSFGSPSLIAMAAAARTRRIRLGTGVSLIPLHHPIRLAEEYAMLDVLSGGPAGIWNRTWISQILARRLRYRRRRKPRTLS